MKNIFNSIKLTRPKNNFFDLTHDVKLSMNMGDLVPVMCTECIPGDKFKISAESLIRFAPMIAPVMHRMDVFIHYFFVPNRIIWPGWEKWIVADETATAFPYLDINLERYTKLADYMGIPNPDVSSGTNNLRVSALPFGAYQKIYNEYYRDQNLIDPVFTNLVDGSNTANAELRAMRKRAWMHDYFTASLPFAQKGAAVDIPLGDVVLKDNWDSLPDDPHFQDGSGTTGNGALSSNLGPDPEILRAGSAFNQAYDPAGSLTTEPTTITDLRRAFKLQEWLEKNARAGTRYIENILAHFGVKSSDKRLQRPEYITGVKSPVVISEVLNTTGESAGLPQGNMAGHGVSVAQGKFGSYYCEEHGYIIGIMSVMPITAYQQGVPKHFFKYSNNFDYYWPSFAHIGEQEVKVKEIYAYGSSNPDATFGYVPRYAEYKYEPSRVAGDMRGNLSYWHLGRIFDNEPALNQEFIEANPSKRIFAVEDENEDSLYVHVLNKVKAVRPMPIFGNPMM